MSLCSLSGDRPRAAGRLASGALASYLDGYATKASSSAGQAVSPSREALLNAHAAEIDAFETRQRAERPWLYTQD